MISYTQNELEEFLCLIEAAESRDQLERIRSRLDMPAFIKRVGREKCDAMFEFIKSEMSDGS